MGLFGISMEMECEDLTKKIDQQEECCNIYCKGTRYPYSQFSSTFSEKITPRRIFTF
jgi:hypothetical protein